jgi:hypothetical protein
MGQAHTRPGCAVAGRHGPGQCIGTPWAKDRRRALGPFLLINPPSRPQRKPRLPRRLSSPRLPAAKNPSSTRPPVRPRDAFGKLPARRHGLVPVRRLRRGPQEAQARRPLPLVLRLQGFPASRPSFAPRQFGLIIGFVTCEWLVWFCAAFLHRLRRGLQPGHRPGAHPVHLRGREFHCFYP